MALVTRGDLLTLLLRVLNKNESLRLLRRATSPGGERVKITWSQSRRPIRNWYEIPQVASRQGLLITGSPDKSTYSYVAEKYLSADRLKALSLGSGSGTREIAWAETGKFERIVGIDVSDERVETARSVVAKTPHAGVIEFVQGDVMQRGFQDGSFDVVIAEGILHHLSPVDSAVGKIRRCLRPGGLMVVNEYVGPDRFQWTESQVRYCNALLTLLPAELRKYRGTRFAKSHVFRPGTLSMVMYDPSEAIESSKIIDAVENKFRIVERKDYGGTILQPLLKDIAHNFTDRMPAGEEALQLLFAAEDFLMRSGLIGSDFVFAVARKEGA